MKVVSIQQAKKQFSKLIDDAARGDSFIIAKSGKPLVKLSKLDAAETEIKLRLGFMAGQINIPEDFDQMGKGEIAKLFGT